MALKGTSDDPKKAAVLHDIEQGIERRWRRMLRALEPAWFTVTMGTGVCGIILQSIPWHADWLWALSIVFMLLTTIIWVLLSLASLWKYLTWPKTWKSMIDHPINVVFVGAFPIGFATIIEIWIISLVPHWGLWATYVAWGFWVVDAVIAVCVTLGVTYLLICTTHHRSLEDITAVHILPLAATIIAAGTGSDLCVALPKDGQRLAVLNTCYILWGLSIPAAISVLFMYHQRLYFHKVPPHAVLATTFIPLAPLGFGGYTILNLGKSAATIFTETTTLSDLAGQIAYVLGFFVALVMWSWGLLWLALSLTAMVAARSFPFNISWWSFTFPLGVYSLSTILIGQELPSLFFRVLGTILGVCTTLIWIAVASRTIYGIYAGTLLNAKPPLLPTAKTPALDSL